MRRRNSMGQRQHSMPLVALFAGMVYIAALFVAEGEPIPMLIRCACVALSLAGAALALVEMADFYMFGNEERDR